MAYKKTKTVEKIEESMDEYLDFMHHAGKKPSAVYVTTKQYNNLLEDRNKAAKNVNPNHKDFTEMGEYRGYPIRIFNP